MRNDQGICEDASLLKEFKFSSPALEREVTYRALFPEDYDRDTLPYPALYLLHGLYGDRTNWTTLTKIADYARPYKIVIVMPDAGNSWYVNSVSDSKDRFEDFIANDLTSEVERSHRVIPRRESRAIVGLSMGGYGAIKFALKNPAGFVFVGSMTGALSAPGDLANQMPEFRDGLLTVFGAAGHPNRARNDVFALAAHADPTALPYFYLDCGISDGFLQTNRDFAALLQKRGIPYEYHELPGAHEWEYWDSRLTTMLSVLRNRLS